MKIEEGILYLDGSYDNEKIAACLGTLGEKLQEIEEIVLDHNIKVESSALFALVASLQKSKIDIKVSLFEKQTHFAGLGNITFV